MQAQDHRPYLSIILTGRNDNFGGDFNDRLFRALTGAVRNLADPERFVPMLRQLGRDHRLPQRDVLGVGHGGHCYGQSNSKK